MDINIHVLADCHLAYVAKDEWVANELTLDPTHHGLEI